MPKIGRRPGRGLAAIGPSESLQGGDVMSMLTGQFLAVVAALGPAFGAQANGQEGEAADADGVWVMVSFNEGPASRPARFNGRLSTAAFRGLVSGDARGLVLLEDAFYFSRGSIYTARDPEVGQTDSVYIPVSGIYRVVLLDRAVVERANREKITAPPDDPPPALEGLQGP